MAGGEVNVRKVSSRSRAELKKVNKMPKVRLHYRITGEDHIDLDVEPGEEFENALRAERPIPWNIDYEVIGAEAATEDAVKPEK